MLRSPLLFVLLLGTVLPAQEGGIEVFAGETIFDGGYRWSLTELYKKDDHIHQGSDEIANPFGDKWVEHRTVLGFDYGIRPDLQLSILVPYVQREFTSSGVRSDVEALGDTAVLIKQRIYKEDWKAGSFNVALVGGVELPTGETGATTAGVRNPFRAQTGSGSWDSFVAVAANLGSGRARYDALVFYKENNRGSRRFEEGDSLIISATAGYRVYNAEYPGMTVGMAAGLKYQHRSHSKMGSASIADSGSDVLFLHLGVTVHPIPRMDLAVGLDHPLYSNYNGTQLSRDIQLSVTFGLRF